MCSVESQLAPALAVAGIDLNLELMGDNNQSARFNRARFDAAGVCCLNLMSSPGTGKTTLLERTLAAIEHRWHAAVLEGDMATELDADRLRAYGVPVVALTTGRACHLDADLVAKGLDQLDLAALDLVLVENVGNLICPAEYPLGAHANVVLVSVTEGEDKPLKYPVMFYEADCVVITKTDLLPYLKINVEQLAANIRQIRPGASILTVSAETGEGMSAWLDWIGTQMKVTQGEPLLTVTSSGSA